MYHKLFKLEVFNECAFASKKMSLIQWIIVYSSMERLMRVRLRQIKCVEYNELRIIYDKSCRFMVSCRFVLLI